MIVFAQTPATNGTAQPPAGSPAAATAARGGLETLVVTARRRKENIQKVPVSVQAFSGTTLANRGIQNTAELAKAVPGVVFSGGGSNENTTFAVRGQGRDLVGAGLPSVISYLNDVPLPAVGSVLPTYDVSSVQVLKGPQGTLFGRNTTGGAVLVDTAPPNYRYGGYLQGLLGDYAWRDAEGAANFPLIDQTLALRIAGKVTSRDGYSDTILGPNVSEHTDNLDSRNVRVSLLFQPTQYITNTTVFDFENSNTDYAGTFVFRQTPTPIYDYGSAAFGPALGPLIDLGFACATSISCNIDQQILRQQKAGARTTFSDVPTFSHLENYGVSNTTEIKLDSLTIKNIFGLRDVALEQQANSDGVAAALINTQFNAHYRQYTDEVQLSGSLMSNRLNWLVGAFYLESQPDGSNGVTFDDFRPYFIPSSVPLIGSVENNFFSDDSKALFGNLRFEIVKGLTLNGGIRHTWDRESVCSLPVQPVTVPPLATLGQCAASPGAFQGSTTSDATTWSVGLDYQLLPTVFTYVVGRHGYRAGGLNTPALGGLLTGYQNYKPQTVTDVEVGVKAGFTLTNLVGRVNIAAFRGEFDNLQRQITGVTPNLDKDNNPLDDPSNTSLVINAGTSRVQGFELDTTYKLYDVLQLGGQVSYLDAAYTSLATPAIFDAATGSNEYSNAPRWSYSFNAQYTFPFTLFGGNVSIGGDYYFIGSYYVAPFRVPAYKIIDASLDIRDIAGKPITLSLFVNNLTNTTYISTPTLSSDGLGVYSGSYGEPRMFGVRARYTF